MQPSTRLISIRLPHSDYQALSTRCRQSGLSPGLQAKELLLERLRAMEESERAIPILLDEVKALRADLELATRGILNVLTTNDPPDPDSADEWARRNLNR